MGNLQISSWLNSTCEFSRVAVLMLSPMLVAEVALAQSNEGLSAVVGKQYREFVAPTQVSSHAIVGLTTKPSLAQKREDILYVFFKDAFDDAKDGPIRVELTTADGYLRGEGEFRGKVPRRTWEKVSIELPPPRDERARSARERSGPETLAVVARFSQTGAPLVVHWGNERPTGAPAELRLYVNSRRAELFVRLQASEKPVHCQPISGTTLVRFDKICDISASQLPKDGKVTLVRRDGFETESFQFVIPWVPN